MDEQADYEIARRRVKQLRGFYLHAATYALVNAFLVVLNYLSSPGTYWAIWPIAGWGLGLAMHALAVFGFFGLWGPRWEEHKIRELMEKNRPGR